MKTPLFTAGARSNLGSATLILDSDDCEIADCARSSHAAFIVRACNSHADLVEALMLAERRLSLTNDIIEGGRADGGTVSVLTTTQNKEALASVRAVLAAAKS